MAIPEFSNDDPHAMTPEERAYYDRAAENVGAGPGSFIKNIVSGYFRDRGAEVVVDDDDDDDMETMHVLLMNDPRYETAIKALDEASEAAALATAKLYKAEDDLHQTRELIEREVGRMLIAKNKLRDGDVSPEDIINPSK